MSRPTIKILSLGTELKLLRLSLGLSRSELAKKVGLTRQAIYWWETRGVSPDYFRMMSKRMRGFR